MLLTIDIGNTTTGILIYDKEIPVFTHRIDTILNVDADKTANDLLTIFESKRFDYSLVKESIISSVVPTLTPLWKNVVNKLFNIDLTVVDPTLHADLKIDVDNPDEIGSDLLCDMVAALKKYGPSSLVIDMGTATKYLLIDKNSCFSGACFTPGMKLSFKALTNGTALLPDFEFSKPDKFLGKNTKDCMNSGIVLGTVLQVKALISAIENEVGYSLTKIITGGYGTKLKDMFPEFIIEENLVFEGLRLINESLK